MWEWANPLSVGVGNLCSQTLDGLPGPACLPRDQMGETEADGFE